MVLERKVRAKKVYLIAVLFLTVVLFTSVSAEVKQDAVGSKKGKDSLVLYYSRSNKTRLVAEVLSKAMDAECVQIKSKKNR